MHGKVTQRMSTIEGNMEHVEHVDDVDDADDRERKYIVI
jgi:hypothetical protein